MRLRLGARQLEPNDITNKLRLMSAEKKEMMGLVERENNGRDSERSKKSE